MLKGIQFGVNDRGEKTAVQIDLSQYGELVENSPAKKISGASGWGITGLFTPSMIKIGM